MRWRGFNIDSGIFDLKFNPPQNFASYRQTELDTARVSVFTSVEAFPYMSKRFMMERFLGLSKEEIVENAKMWKEEREEPVPEDTKGSDLRGIGISPSDIDSDLEQADDLSSAPPDQGMAPEVTAPVGSAPTGGAAPGGAPVGAAPGV
jgi:hypothetical protein